MLNRVFGFFAFIVTFITYAMTVQPSVPFWDCGEFTAASTWQQICHPPGAPLFLLMGRVTQILFPFGDLGWRVNMLSVLATAIAAMLLYFIIVKVIQNFRKEDIKTVAEAIAIFGSGLVGALAFCYSDTMWFNGVESEVYAMSTLFTTFTVYLLMRWNEDADNPGHERWLLFIAYIIGLSMGVHLLAILTIFSIVMLVYFRKYEFKFKSFIIMGIIALIAFWIVYVFVLTWIPTMLAGDFPIRNAAKEHLIEDSSMITILALLIIAAAGYGYYYGNKKDWPILKLSCAGFLLLLFGFTTYTQVLIRSNAHPPMNENEPKTFSSLISYLGREQYGDAGNWPRRTDFNDETKMSIYNRRDANGEYVYGEWTAPETERVPRRDGTTYPVPKWNNVNFGGELSYMWNYQMDHMFFRYFFWNYVGKISDQQDAGSCFIDKSNSEVINYKTGFADQFPVRFFALPLLLGLFGMFYHFKRDPKYALVFLIMFLLMGVLAAIAQNQQDPQPRERDYFYCGAFLVWCLWIGMGVYTLIDWIVKNKQSAMANATVLLVCIVAVPVNMAVGGWSVHSRANNWIPFDYSYNILQSTEKDAILFTNGDNDTFPLWYLQDVEGVRRDVRVCNLSLGQTLWYIDQMKNREPWGAKRLPLSFSDASLQAEEMDEKALKYDVGEAQMITIDVRPEILAKFTNDTAVINRGKFTFKFTGQSLGEQEGKQMFVFHVNHKLIVDILKQTKFERPVYFSTTVGPDVFVGLTRYLRYEGMALRICPVPSQDTKTGMVNSDIMAKCMLNIDNSDNYHKEPHFGFKYRYLDNHKYVYYDEVHRRLMQNYRQLYMTFAAFELEKQKDTAQAIAILDTMNKYISPVRFPLYHDEESQMALIYKEAGAKEQARKWAEMCLKSCNEIFANKKLRVGRVEREEDEIKGRQGTYKSSAQSYMILGNFEAARTSLKTLYDMSMSAFQSIAQNKQYANEAKQIQRNVYDILGNIAAIDDEEISALERQGLKKEALAKAEDYRKKYNESKDPLFKQLGMYLDEKIAKMTGVKKDTASY